MASGQGSLVESGFHPSIVNSCWLGTLMYVKSYASNALVDRADWTKAGKLWTKGYFGEFGARLRGERNQAHLVDSVLAKRVDCLSVKLFKLEG